MIGFGDNNQKCNLTMVTIINLHSNKTLRRKVSKLNSLNTPLDMCFEDSRPLVFMCMTMPLKP